MKASGLWICTLTREDLILLLILVMRSSFEAVKVSVGCLALKLLAVPRDKVSLKIFWLKPCSQMRFRCPDRHLSTITLSYKMKVPVIETGRV
jgi:hypothetical protein